MNNTIFFPPLFPWHVFCKKRLQQRCPNVVLTGWKFWIGQQVESLSFFSLLCSTSYWRKLLSAHRRAIMWFQCLCPWGIAPSGGKPLRRHWPITAPIINSRSALSFLLHLSSLLFTAVCLLVSSLCFWFIHLHSPLHISFNLLSWQCLYLTVFFFCLKLLCTELCDCFSHSRNSDSA